MIYIGLQFVCDGCGHEHHTRRPLPTTADALPALPPDWTRSMPMPASAVYCPADGCQQKCRAVTQELLRALRIKEPT
jgi:hypothetical protein